MTTTPLLRQRRFINIQLFHKRAKTGKSLDKKRIQINITHINPSDGPHGSLNHFWIV
jgi:hypothetical protein